MLSDEQLQRLYQYGYSLTNQEADAYDLLHTALEKYLIKYSDKQTVKKPEFMLRRIMRNHFIDQLRHQQRYPLESLDQSSLQAADDVTTLEQLAINDDLIGVIWNQLNPIEREMLYLWAMEGYTAQEIADQTDTPRGTILARIHRLKQKLTNNHRAHNGHEVSS